MKKSKKEEIKFYSLDNILKENCDYNIIIGERSNGKTTSVLRYGLKNFVESGYKYQLAVIRRWQEDFKGKNGEQMFESVVELGDVKKLTNNQYNTIIYKSMRWYLAYYNNNGEKIRQMETPFALGFSIASQEHYKSTSYPNIKYVLFDEFITREYYLPDEFVKFQNLLSTIIRLRNDVKIFMLGNTVNKYCIYFNEMGLTNIKNQRKNTIEVYTYGDSELKVAVEYCQMDNKSKKSNKYFAFNNPKLNMITNGNWEIDIYPHAPCKFKPKDIIYIYFINFDGDLLQCEIIKIEEEDMPFTFIHRKTTELKEDNENLVFDTTVNLKSNYRRRITNTFDEIGKKIWWFFNTDRVYYQDNEVGEIVRNYIMWCKKV